MTAKTTTDAVSRNAINEFWGGLAAMLAALSSIAFGIVMFSAVSPQMAGQGSFISMIGAAALGLAAPLFGRRPALVSAPCAPASAILSGYVTFISYFRML